VRTGGGGGGGDVLETLLIDRSILGAPVTEPAWIATFFLKILAVNILGYVIPAGLVFGLVCVVFRRRLEPARLQKGRRATWPQMRREILWSASAVAVFSFMSLAIVTMAAAGWTQLYFRPEELGWGYLFFSFILLTVLHDAYFYWTHRIMHHRWIFDALHLVHHRSITPTPWACYCFSPGEAVVQALFLPLVIFAIPFYPPIVVAFAVHQILRNTLGHSGFELMPPVLARSRWASWLISATHHDLHHSQSTGNFALYFTWWDRLFRTDIRRSTKTNENQNSAPAAH